MLCYNTGVLEIKNMLGFNVFKWEEEVISGDIEIKNLEMLFNRID